MNGRCSSPRSTIPLLLGMMLIVWGCAPRPPVPPGVPDRPEDRPPVDKPAKPARDLRMVRVVLREEASEISVTLDAGGECVWNGGSVTVPPGGEIYIGARGTETIHVSTADGRKQIGGTVRLIPGAGGAVDLGDRRYAGTLEITHTGNGLLAINRIMLEEYLRGVVGWEIGFVGEDRLEAAKAQAVAARTYALTRVIAAEGPWDLRGDIMDQVYRGLEKTTEVIDRAISETAGIVATHQGELLRTYYSSTCGGRTAPLQEVWFDRVTEPYLQGVIDAPRDSRDARNAYCHRSSKFQWREEITGSAAMAAIVSALATESGENPSQLGRLENIKITKRGSTGRIHTAVFQTEGGDVTIHGDRVRWVIRRPDGGGLLFSSWFDLDLERAGERVVGMRIEGRGYGHGIGMCQWGAMGMALEGHRYDEILKHYYPGVTLRKATDALLLGGC